MKNLRAQPSLEHAIEAIETASSVDEVVAVLARHADAAGELAEQVFPPELRNAAGVSSLALELARLGMKRGLDEDRDWAQLEVLFARAAVRLSQLSDPAARGRFAVPRPAGSTRSSRPAAPR